MLRKELQLSYVIQQMILNLVKAGVIQIKDGDIEELKKKVLENLEQIFGIGNLPKGNVLKDPRMLMKLTLCIVAAHVLQKGRAQSCTQQVFKFNNAAHLTDLLEKLEKELQNNPEFGKINNFKLLLKFLLKEAKEKEALEQQNQKTAQLENDPNSPDNTYSILVIGGVVVDIIEGVFGKTKAEQVLTPEEISSMGKMPEIDNILTFGQTLLAEMNAMEMRPTLTPSQK